MVKLLVTKIKDNIMGQPYTSNSFMTEILQNNILQCVINEGSLVHSGIFLE